MFLFPTKKEKPAKQEEGPLGVTAAPKEQEQLPTVIQGRPVGSKEEARVAIGLEVVGWRYIYQKAYYGGSGTPGGIVVDFLVLTPGLMTPLLVQSRYWHTIRSRESKDFYQISRLSKIPNLAQPIEIWDYELQTIQATISLLRQRLGSG